MFELFAAPAAMAGAVLESEAEAPAPLPPGVRRMLSVATKVDDPAQRDAVIATAKAAYPELTSEIDAFLVDLARPVTPLLIDPYVVLAPVQPEMPKPGYWQDFHSELLLNAAQTNGNSDTLHFGAAAKVDMKRDSRIHRLSAYGNITEANGVESQKNWGAAYQLDTLWTDVHFGYLRGSLDRDDFAGFETVAFLGVGVGKYLMQTEALSIRTEFGPGYRYLALANENKEIHAPGLYTSFELDWLLDDDWTLEFDTKATLSAPTTTVHPIARISAGVTDRVRAGVSYDFRYESDPPLLAENYDSSLRVDLVFSY